MSSCSLIAGNGACFINQMHCTTNWRPIETQQIGPIYVLVNDDLEVIVDDPYGKPKNKIESYS